MANARKANPRDETTFRGDKVKEEYLALQERMDNEKAMADTAVRRINKARSQAMSMIDPSEWNLDEAQEPTTVPDGTECRLRIIEVTKGIDKNGSNYYLPRFEIVDEPYAKDFTQFLSEPNEKIPKRQLNRIKYNMLQFMTAFDIDRGGPTDPTEDWINHEGWAILGHKIDPQYGEQNYVKKFIAPR